MLAKYIDALLRKDKKDRGAKKEDEVEAGLDSALTLFRHIQVGYCGEAVAAVTCPLYLRIPLRCLRCCISFCFFLPKRLFIHDLLRGSYALATIHRCYTYPPTTTSTLSSTLPSTCSSTTIPPICPSTCPASYPTSSRSTSTSAIAAFSTPVDAPCIIRWLLTSHNLHDPT